MRISFSRKHRHHTVERTNPGFVQTLLTDSRIYKFPSSESRFGIHISEQMSCDLRIEQVHVVF
jgi:hypothetical protein